VHLLGLMFTLSWDFYSQHHVSNVLYTMLSVLSIGHSMVFLEELVELPRMRLLYGL